MQAEKNIMPAGTQFSGTQSPSKQTSSKRSRIRPRRMTRGFTLAEVGLATAILLLMGILFSAAVPSVLRAPQFSNNYAQAGELAQHKIDQLRASGYNALSQPVQLQGLGIINGVNPDKSYDFTVSDSLGSYFPNGSTGTVALVADPNAPAHTVVDVTITINWTGNATHAGTYVTRTMISS